MDVFELAAKISLDTSAYESGLSKAKSSFGSLGSMFQKISSGGTQSLDKVMTKAQVVGNVISGAFQKVGSVISSSMDGAVARVDTLNSYTRVMKGLGYSAEDSQKAINKLSDGIQGLPTTLPGIASVQQQFTALMGDLDKSTDLTIALNNAVLAGGQGQEIANSALNQWYQMIANGKPDLQSWRIINSAMPAQMKAIAQETMGAKASAQDLFTAWQKGTVTTEQVEQAIEKLNKEGGKGVESFADQAQSACGGIATSFQNVQTKIKTVLGNIIQAMTDNGLSISGILDHVKSSIGDLGDHFTEVAKQIDWKTISDNITTLIDKSFELINSIDWASIINGLAEVGQVFTDVFTSVFDMIDKLRSGGDITQDVNKIATSITGLVENVASVLAKGIPAVIQIATQLITSFIQSISQHAPEILDAGMNILKTLAEGITKNLPLIVDAVSDLFKTITNYVSKHKKEVSEEVADVVTTIVDGVTELAPQMADVALTLVSALGSGLIKAVPEIVKQMPKFVGSLMGAVGDAFIHADAGGKLAIATIVGKTVSGGISNGLTKAKDVKDIAGKVSDIFGKVKDYDFKGTAEAFGMLGDSLKMVAGLSFDSIKTFFTTVGETLSNGISTGIQTLGSAFSTLGTALTNVGSAIASGVLTGLQTLGTFITGTMIPAAGQFMAALVPWLPLIVGIAAAIVGIILVIKNWDKVSAALQVTWQALQTAAKVVFNAIVTAITAAWNAIKAVTTAVWGAIKTVVVGYWTAIGTVAKTAFNAIKTVITAVWNAIKAVTSSVWSGISGILTGIWSKISSTASKMFSQVKSIVSKMASVVQSKVKDFVSAGGNLVKGLWNGIKDKTQWIISKIKGFGKDVVDGMKKIFGIHSPSTVMEKEIGVNLALGVAKGITKTTGKVTKASEKLAKEVLNTTKKASKGKYTDDDYVKAIEKRIKTLKEGNKITNKEEAALWASVSKRVKKGSDAYAKAVAKITTVAKKGSKDLLDLYQKQVDNYSAFHNGEEMSASALVGYWDTARKSFKKGSDEWITAQKNYLSAKKSLEDSEKQASDQLNSDLANAEKTYQDALQATIDKVKQKAESLKSSLGNFYEAFDSGDPVSISALFSAQDSQIAAEEQGNVIINSLKDKLGENSPLFKQLHDMGYKDGLEYWKAFNNMSDEQLQKYVEGYNKLNTDTEDEAKFLMSDEIQADSKKAAEQYIKDISDAYQTYNDTLADLGVKVEGLNESMTDNLTEAGETYGNFLVEMNTSTGEQMDNIQNTIHTTMDSITGDARTSGKDMMDNFIAGIRSKIGSLRSVLDELAQMTADTIGFSEPKRGPLSNFHTYAPDMMDLYSQGIKDNGYKVIDAMDNVLGYQPTTDDFGSFSVGGMSEQSGNVGGAILSLLQTYLPTLGNQQIVLDDGTLVGATANRMNEELAYVNGRRAGAFA